MSKLLLCPLILTSEQAYPAIEVKRGKIAWVLALKNLQLFQSPLGISLKIKILGNAECIIVPCILGIVAGDQQNCQQNDSYELHA